MSAKFVHNKSKILMKSKSKSAKLFEREFLTKSKTTSAKVSITIKYVQSQLLKSIWFFQNIRPGGYSKEGVKAQFSRKTVLFEPVLVNVSLILNTKNSL